jgi:hypothetical protein
MSIDKLFDRRFFGLFAGLNYIGQRPVAFREKK